MLLPSSVNRHKPTGRFSYFGEIKSGSGYAVMRYSLANGTGEELYFPVSVKSQLYDQNNGYILDGRISVRVD